MTRTAVRWFLISVLTLAPLGAFAQDAPAAAETAAAEPAPAELDDLAKADAIYDKGGLKNVKESLPLYEKVVAAKPDDYEANWKMGRAYREYANLSMERNVNGWKGICKEYGKKALNYAGKATQLKPKGMEGHFWYGCAAGTYADGVSIVTALSEGLADKTKVGFETAYKIDKRYSTGGPIKALGRYWTVLPWPLKDLKKGMKYLDEYEKAYPNNCEGQVYLAEALIDRDDKGDEERAKAVLQKTLKCKNKFYVKQAQKLLKDLD